ncbi:hypothetical protein [Kineococcus esterisolvens]|uniref:hypothetical protein n=1 Tax=unclassified Kineococcus TaxID=2621656 RepID=UPI003D7E26A4
MPLLMTAIVGCLAFEFQIALPVVARETFGDGPTTCGLLTAAPSLPLALAALTVTGAVSVALQSTGNTTPQLNSLPVRAGQGDGPVVGRLPRLDPVGGPVAGLVSDWWGGRELVLTHRTRRHDLVNVRWVTPLGAETTSTS